MSRELSRPIIAPVAVVGTGGDIILEAQIRLLLPEGATVIDAIQSRLGSPFDLMLGDVVIESARMHLDRGAPLASYAEVILRAPAITIREPS